MRSFFENVMRSLKLSTAGFRRVGAATRQSSNADTPRKNSRNARRARLMIFINSFLQTKKTGVATDATPVEESIKSLWKS
jgi:hypothetical protein